MNSDKNKPNNEERQINLILEKFSLNIEGYVPKDLQEDQKEAMRKNVEVKKELVAKYYRDLKKEFKKTFGNEYNKAIDKKIFEHFFSEENVKNIMQKLAQIDEKTNIIEKLSNQHKEIENNQEERE